MNNNLNNEYLQLLQKAEDAVSRQDALHLIHLADRLRMQMSTISAVDQQGILTNQMLEP